jgi:hypothetical protein
MDRRQVVISGTGVAAAACHALLRRSGWRTIRAEPQLQDEERSVPYIALNGAAWAVVSDVFGRVPSDPWRTTRCLVVHHGADSVFARSETQFVIPVESLRFPEFIPAATASLTDDFVVEARSNSDTSAWISSGERSCWISSARSVAKEAQISLILEFVPEGWVFWMPIGSRLGILQWFLPVATSGDQLCTELWRTTKILRRWTAPAGEWHIRGLPAAARIARRLVGPEAISCGSAAMRFDPISGDGTGASLRSSILASASIRYRDEHPRDAGKVLQHYESRMYRAFNGHIRSCIRYYSEAGLSSQWDNEHRTMREADALTAPLGNEPSSSFQLRNFSLKPI